MSAISEAKPRGGYSLKPTAEESQELIQKEIVVDPEKLGTTSNEELVELKPPKRHDIQTGEERLLLEKPHTGKKEERGAFKALELEEIVSELERLSNIEYERTQKGTGGGRDITEPWRPIPQLWYYLQQLKTMYNRAGDEYYKAALGRKIKYTEAKLRDALMTENPVLYAELVGSKKDERGWKNTPEALVNVVKNKTWKELDEIVKSARTHWTDLYYLIRTGIWDPDTGKLADLETLSPSKKYVDFEGKSISPDKIAGIIAIYNTGIFSQIKPLRRASVIV